LEEKKHEKDRRDLDVDCRIGCDCRMRTRTHTRTHRRAPNQGTRLIQRRPIVELCPSEQCRFIQRACQQCRVVLGCVERYVVCRTDGQ
jgi:hypothetical protein